MFLVSLFPLLEYGGELEDRDEAGREGGGGTDNTRDLVLHVLTLHAGLQQASLHSVGHLHYLGLREAVLLADFLADVFEKRHHGVEGGTVSDELRVSLALPPLLSHGLHTVRLLGLDWLETALLDRDVPAVVLVLNLRPGDLHILADVLSHGLTALGGDGVLLSGAVRSVVQQGVAKPKLRLRSGESLAGRGHQEETGQEVHLVAEVKIAPEVPM